MKVILMNPELFNALKQTDKIVPHPNGWSFQGLPIVVDARVATMVEVEAEEAKQAFRYNKDEKGWY